MHSACPLTAVRQQISQSASQHLSALPHFFLRKFCSNVTLSLTRQVFHAERLTKFLVADSVQDFSISFVATQFG